jgi:hypothetical protein
MYSILSAARFSIILSNQGQVFITDRPQQKHVSTVLLMNCFTYELLSNEAENIWYALLPMQDKIYCTLGVSTN